MAGAYIMLGMTVR